MSVGFCDLGIRGFGRLLVYSHEFGRRFEPVHDRVSSYESNAARSVSSDIALERVVEVQMSAPCLKYDYIRAKFAPAVQSEIALPVDSCSFKTFLQASMQSSQIRNSDKATTLTLKSAWGTIISVQIGQVESEKTTGLSAAARSFSACKRHAMQILVSAITRSCNLLFTTVLQRVH